MKRPKLIHDVFVFTAIDPDDGDEGLTAFMGPDETWYPMIACDQARIASLTQKAKEVAKATGREIKIYRFTTKTHIGTVTKDGLTTVV